MTLFHKDTSLRHNDPGLKHNSTDLRHNDPGLLHNGGAAAGLAHVKTTTVSASADGSEEVATPNLDGGSGSERLIVGIFTGQQVDGGDLISVSLGGNAGTVLGNFSVTVSGGRSIHLNVAYWPDTDHPGAGEQELRWEWDTDGGSSVGTLLEFDGVDQSSPFSTVDNQTAQNVTADNLDLTVSVNNEAGELGVVALAGVDDDNNSLTGDNQAHACTNIDSEEEDQTEFSTGRAIWLDNAIENASQDYDLSASSDDTVILNWSAIAFAIRAAA